MSPRPTVLAVANRRNARCGRITWFWSSRVIRPCASSTRWMTNITSGRPASYSSKTSATGRCSDQGRMPSRYSVICLPSLQDDRVLADQVDPADVAVEVDADAGPVQPRRHLLDVRRLAGAVIALDHDPAVVGEAGQDRQRRVAVELVGRVDVGHILGAPAEGRRPADRCRCRRSARDAEPEIRLLRQIEQVRRVALGSTQIHGQALQGRKRGRYAASAPRAATPGNVPGRLRI